jgi:hypothetical protein
MQRLHEDDLVGHVLEQEEWKLLRLPAFAEEDDSRIVGGKTAFPNAYEGQGAFAASSV